MNTLNMIAAFLIICSSVVYADIEVKHYRGCENVQGVFFAKDRFYAASTGGLIEYSSNMDLINRYFQVSGIPAELSVSAAAQDEEGDLWVATESNHLIHIDLPDMGFEVYDSYTEEDNKITGIEIDGMKLFILYRNSMSIFSIDEGHVKYNINDFSTLQSPEINSLSFIDSLVYMVSEQGIATAARDEGTNFYDPGVWSVMDTSEFKSVCRTDTGLFYSPWHTVAYEGETYSFTNQGTPSVMKNGDVMMQFPEAGGITSLKILKERDEVLIGTESGGASVVSLLDWSRRDFDLPQGPIQSRVEDFMKTGSGELFYITEAIMDGIGRHDNGTWEVFNHENTTGFGTGRHSNVNSPNTIEYFPELGDVWFTAYSHGIKIYTPGEDRWSYMMDSTQKREGFIESPLTRFGEDVSNFWTFSSGVCRDSSGYIWVTNHRAYTEDVIHIFDPEDGTWRSLNMDAYGILHEFTGPVAAAEKNGVNYIHLGYTEYEGRQAGGGYSVISYSGDPMEEGSISIESNENNNIFVNDIEIVNRDIALVASNLGAFRSEDNSSELQGIDALNEYSAVFYDFEVTPGKNIITGVPLKGLISYNEYSQTYIKYSDSSEILRWRSEWDSGDMIKGDTSIITEYYFSRVDPGNRISAVYKDPYEEVIWAGSEKGIYRVSGFSEKEYSSLSMVGLFPNPVSRRKLNNRETMIRIENIPKFSEVAVYSRSGRLIRNLSGMYAEDGSTVEWNGRNTQGVLMSPGVYIYSVLNEGSEEGRKTGKFIVVP